MRKATWIAAALAASLGLAACGSSSGGGSDSGPVKLALIVPETGAFGPVAGVSFRDATKVVVDEYNKAGGVDGRQIDLQICNDESTPEKAISCYRSVSAKADIVLGPHIGLTYKAVSAIALKKSQLLVTATPHGFPDAKSTVFDSAVPAEYAITKAFEYLEGRGLSKVGMLTGNDETGQTAKAAAQKDAAASGGKIQLTSETFDVQARSVTAQVNKLKAAGVDTIFVWSTGAVVATILRDIDQVGLDLPVVVNYSNLSYGLMSLVPKNAVPKELLFTGTRAFTQSKANAAQQKFYKSFDADFLAMTKRKPDFNAYAAADAAVTALQAVDGAKSTSGKDLKAWLEAGNEIDAPNFVFKFGKGQHVGGTDPAQVEIVKWNGAGWDPAGQ